MASARGLYRLVLALAGLGLLAVAGGVAAAGARSTFSVPSAHVLAAACRDILPAGLTLLAVGVVALVGIGLVVLVQAALSAARHLRQDRNFRRSLRIRGEVELGGLRVALLEDREAHAFCAGLLRPRIYLTTAALARLSERELLAVLAHEDHHRKRRDPLRLALAAVLADALFFLPALRQLAERYRALSEVAADEAATRAAGASTVAAALLAFSDSSSPAAVVGIAPERVDHLVGETPGWQLSASLLLGAALALIALSLAVVTMVSVSAGQVDLTAVVAQSCMALMCGAALATAGLGLVLSRLRRGRRWQPSSQ